MSVIVKKKIRLHDGYRNLLVALCERPCVVTGHSRYTDVRKFGQVTYVSMPNTMWQALKGGGQPLLTVERRKMTEETCGDVERTVATVTDRGRRVLEQGWFVPL